MINEELLKFHVFEQLKDDDPPTAHSRVRGGLLSSLGGVVIRIRILMYCDVSCVYPEGYMYPSCILMYLKCILNALLHSKRIHVS